MAVGTSVGATVGVAGAAVGMAVAEVGFTVGVAVAAVGFPVGVAVAEVGFPVGVAVVAAGFLVGVAVVAAGFPVGAAACPEGLVVGVVVGISLDQISISGKSGISVGSDVGSAVVPFVASDVEAAVLVAEGTGVTVPAGVVTGASVLFSVGADVAWSSEPFSGVSALLLQQHAANVSVSASTNRITRVFFMSFSLLLFFHQAGDPQLFRRFPHSPPGFIYVHAIESIHQKRRYRLFV